jgi:hypothetical protein
MMLGRGAKRAAVFEIGEVRHVTAVFLAKKHVGVVVRHSSSLGLHTAWVIWLWFAWPEQLP